MFWIYKSYYHGSVSCLCIVSSIETTRTTMLRISFCSKIMVSCAGSIGKVFGRLANPRIGWRWIKEALRSGRISQQRLDFNTILRKESML